jgi:hypothetical protein
MIHGNGTGSIIGSAHFLVSYGESLDILNQGIHAGTSDKGKTAVLPGSCKGLSGSRRGKGGPKPLEKWKPPPPGWVKLNIDAGFCSSSDMAGTGVVVRDPDGKVLLTAWQFLRHCGSPEEAEADACLQELILLMEWIKQPTCFESDCLGLIKAMGANLTPRSDWAGIIAEIQATRNLLSGSTIGHVCREANKVAHELAQRAMKNQVCVVMRLNAPDCVRCQLEEKGSRGCV